MSARSRRSTRRGRPEGAPRRYAADRGDRGVRRVARARGARSTPSLASSGRSSSGESRERARAPRLLGREGARARPPQLVDQVDDEGEGRPLRLRRRAPAQRLALRDPRAGREHRALHRPGRARPRLLGAEAPLRRSIDEVDKADVEFPNDLLHEIDSMEFEVTETGRRVRANERPVVIITSNAEKELPDAFLRRCVFHYIEFPDRSSWPRSSRSTSRTSTSGSSRRRSTSSTSSATRTAVRKKPSTSELIDWLLVLLRGGVSAEDLGREVPFLGAPPQEGAGRRAREAGRAVPA